MEKRERPNAETYQNIEELASGVQECPGAGLGFEVWVFNIF